MNKFPTLIIFLFSLNSIAFAQPIPHQSSSIIIASLKEEISILKENNKVLQKEWMVLKQKENLRELQIADLEFQQRQLMLANKLQLVEVANQQKQNETVSPSPSTLDPAAIQKEIEQDESQLSAISQQKITRAKEIKDLKTANAQLVRSAQDAYVKKEKEKRDLEQKIKGLESRRKQNPPPVTSAANLPPSTDERAKLVEEAASFQKKNQDLRMEIDDLNQKIGSLKLQNQSLEKQLKSPAQQKE